MDCLLINGYGIDKAGVAFPGSLSSKMDDSAAREDACREYQSSLEDLTFNSKPHINMLTILAEENLNFAKDIVAIIEAQISKAPATEKLPVLYLVDSIVKNVGGEYLAVFAKNLITSFICVFEKVDENTRKSLFKLRSTWDDVFPLKKLYALDVRVNSLDPAWPIKPLPPTVNASIHVNPKFLKQSEEASSPQPVPSQPAPAPAPAPQPVPAISQSSLTQEQLIRQQLLAKQKQLLELQQKKIELELEHTKAQLAGGFVLPTPAPASTPAAQTTVPKLVSQTAPVVRPWIPPQTQSDTKPSTRDPRLNRTSTPAASQPKEQPAGKKDSPPKTGSPALTPEKRLPEKSPRPDKARIPRKEVLEEKPKSKSPSPIVKSVQSKNKQVEAEVPKSGDGMKKDPRLRKRTQDKTGEAKDDELKEKKRCSDKKEREEAAQGAEPQRFSKGKLVNGSVTRHDREESADKVEFKTGGNARTHARKRTRSRSRSRSPTSSPKRKDRRSPKGRARSSSLSPSPSHKPGKPRRIRVDEPQHGKPGREDRLMPKKNQSESRRSKRPSEDRHSESRDSHSPRSHDGGSKETKEAPHRWRSGWEETKHLKLSEDPHVKPGPQRHKPYSTPTRPTTPRTPKHRLSVDANLQIPEVLNSASKKDLLRRASKRLESGEISQEDFLNMAHQIKHFFQYQEEKQQRSESWDDSGDFSIIKQPLLTTPPSAQLRPHETMDAAELSYYEHKSKLRKTQVTHRVTGEEWEGEESPEDGEEVGTGEKTGGGRSTGHPLSHKYSRGPRERQGERRSKEREEPRPPLGPMIEEYNHGKEFPTLKSLPGLRFRRRADPRESSEREWNSPLTERQRYDEREEQKSGYDAPRRYAPSVDPRHPDPRRPEGHPPSGTVVHRNCPSPAGMDAPAPRFERERLSPLHQKDSAEMSPIPRFESPNSEHSDDGPLNLDVVPPHPHPPPKSILKAPARGGPLSSVRQHSNSPGHTPPHDGGHPPSRYDGPEHMGPPRPHPPGWYDDSSRFNGPHHQGPGRFDGAGPPHHNIPERFDGPDGPPMSHGPMRGGDGIGRFDGHPHPQAPGRFDGPIGQQAPARFVGQGPGPGHFEGPMQRFEPPRRFDNNMAPGPGPGPMGFQQQRPMRFEGPSNQMGPMRFEGPSRFEGPGQPGSRYDIPNVPHQGGPPRFEGPPGQQVPPRFPPQHNLQPPMRQMAPPIYENPMAPQQNFTMAPQCFQESMNPQFPAGPMAFPAQPNLQAGNFNMQTTPQFSQPAPAPFYNSAAPAVGMQQPVNMGNMGNMNQPFLPQNPVPFTPQTPQVVPPENHFGQVDVNDLLSKLISNGIIKPSQPDAAPATSNETSSTAPAAPPAEEEEEEEQEQEEEDEDLPDLTSFTVDDMKQRYESVVTKLYSGNQCCLCSMRFTAAQTDMYADHLDWHFRQNHAGKVASKKVTHRRWYYSLTDWIEFEEIADLEERAKSQFFEKENEEEVQKNQAAAKEKEFQSVRATKDQVGESCEICQEPFETYWVEEEEDWFLKNAIRVDDKNFHPSCFEDYKNTSSYLDVTPSPSKVLADHPLSAFIKTEEEEEGEGTSCAVSATAATSVKQEAEPEAGELPDVKKEEEREVLTDEAQSEESKV
ncbi:pre-mRNA cleavage complex 2 protein Pcf11 [Xiphias gladius]|uniref:pre-mRNA cleavage complex 2 protein Pcf11 n=1 Tax=Xiphias gladius TaxID=8245 RepID=UPI001A993DE9|nr:pre-mRNA cleavage complex 2 protein Pcf11 [Xiphias gladius]